MLTVAPILTALLLPGCKDDPAPVIAATGEGVFQEGCPSEGGTLARQIGVEASLPGKVAVGTAGDYLLANEHAAFVITEPDKGSTYYYYGGIVADAVGMDGCEVLGDDRLDEVALIVGRLELTSIYTSILRGFRGTSAAVIADGSDGGPATVRVTGIDDTFWLVEYEMMAAALSDGGRELSGPLGIELVVDYTLYPDSPVLWIEMTATNTGTDSVSLLTASLLSFGETMDTWHYASGELSLGGLNLGHSIPWLLATDGEASLAYAVEQGNLAYTAISGVQVAVDLIRATTDPLNLAPGQSETATTLLSVGDSDGPSATLPLAEANPEPLLDAPYTVEMVEGVVADPSGAPVPGAAVYIEARSAAADWGVLDVAVAADDGTFSAPVMVFEDGWDWRLTAAADGHDDSAPAEVSPGQTGVALTLSAAGALSYTLIDGAGDPAPARVVLERDDGARFDRWLTDTGTEPIPPGQYTFTATRGYEYSPVVGDVTIPEYGEGVLVAELEQRVDTTGFLSVDTHVHTSHSPDSRMGQGEQLRHAAAHGLEVVINTEHENIVDQSHEPAAAGLSAWVNNVTGEEVTATVPEHMTMFPAVPDGSVRGGIVEWYGMDIADLFEAMRDRSGGGVNLLNHPSYMDLVSWDRDLAAPTLDDPTLLGLLPDAALWSWNFDGVEVFNGHGDISDSGNGRLGNWFSMLNAGHPVAAIGCSDDHNGDQVGFPRTYFASSTDDPSLLSEAELVDAFHRGELIASAGAFARANIDGEGPGALITDADGVVELSIHVEAIPEIDVTHAIVLVNCSEALSLPTDNPDGVIKHSETVSLEITEDAWVVVMAMGEAYLPTGLPQYAGSRTPRVTTNPIYVDADGDGKWTAPGPQDCSYDLTYPE
ncbi:MAG: CehA/McbA family metallohydrolase [Myxococcota bacterium]|nr:CehA/McbA family metallohydrolase [Myxococcota bacterium]